MRKTCGTFFCMKTRVLSPFWWMVAMVVSAAFLRFVPHPPNCTPIAAISLFSGAHFERKAWAFSIPLGAMLLSDVLFELLFGWGLHPQMLIVYASFTAMVGLGTFLRTRRQTIPVVTAAVSSSLLFFWTTNLGVWATSGLYAHTVSGLGACYVAALPFLGTTLLGDLFYTAVLFRGYALLEQRFASGSPAPCGPRRT